MLQLVILQAFLVLTSVLQGGNLLLIHFLMRPDLVLRLPLLRLDGLLGMLLVTLHCLFVGF